MTDRQAQLEALRAPFDKSVIGKLPRATTKDGPKSKCNTCGAYIQQHIHIDYVGHAAVRDRLLNVDLEWNWEPVAWDDDGMPKPVRNSAGGPIGLWIKLTVAGVTRLGYGSTEPMPDAMKVLIGDALRNAAMSFGVALDLWTKDELESHLVDDGDDPKPKSRPSVDRARAAVSRAASGGDGERIGGPAAVPANQSATRRTQPGSGAGNEGTETEEETPTSITTGEEGEPHELTGHAGDSTSPAGLDTRSVTARFAALNATQRSLVRAQLAALHIDFESNPAECARVISEVAGG